MGGVPAPPTSASGMSTSERPTPHMLGPARHMLGPARPTPRAGRAAHRAPSTGSREGRASDFVTAPWTPALALAVPMLRPGRCSSIPGSVLCWEHVSECFAPLLDDLRLDDVVPPPTSTSRARPLCFLLRRGRSSSLASSSSPSSPSSSDDDKDEDEDDATGARFLPFFFVSFAFAAPFFDRPRSLCASGSCSCVFGFDTLFLLLPATSPALASRRFFRGGFSSGSSSVRFLRLRGWLAEAPWSGSSFASSALSPAASFSAAASAAAFLSAAAFFSAALFSARTRAALIASPTRSRTFFF